jgi:hypothetical protein
MLYLTGKLFSHQLQLLVELRVKYAYLLHIFLTTIINPWNFNVFCVTTQSRTHVATARDVSFKNAFLTCWKSVHRAEWVSLKITSHSLWMHVLRKWLLYLPLTSHPSLFPSRIGLRSFPRCARRPITAYFSCEVDIGLKSVNKNAAIHYISVFLVVIIMLLIQMNVHMLVTLPEPSLVRHPGKVVCADPILILVYRPPPLQKEPKHVTCKFNITNLMCFMLHFSLLLKNWNRLMRSPSWLSLSSSPPPSTFKQIGRFLWNLVGMWCH